MFAVGLTKLLTVRGRDTLILGTISAEIALYRVTVNEKRAPIAYLMSQIAEILHLSNVTSPVSHALAESSHALC